MTRQSQKGSNDAAAAAAVSLCLERFGKDSAVAVDDRVPRAHRVEALVSTFHGIDEHRRHLAALESVNLKPGPKSESRSSASTMAETLAALGAEKRLASLDAQKQRTNTFNASIHFHFRWRLPSRVAFKKGWAIGDGRFTVPETGTALFTGSIFSSSALPVTSAKFR